jgi:Na+-driven multidrug efflux pump
MAIVTIACQAAPAAMVTIFSNDADVIRIGVEYLRIVSWASPASGLIFVSSSMFQAMGNTVPSLITSAVRITLVAALTLILVPMPGFALRWIWYLSVVSVVVQLVLSLALLRREFARRLTWDLVASQTTA